MFEKAICFFLGHELHSPFYGRDEGVEWPCERCGEDARPWWIIELDTMNRIERMYLRLQKLEEERVKGKGVR